VTVGVGPWVGVGVGACVGGFGGVGLTSGVVDLEWLGFALAVVDAADGEIVGAPAGGGGGGVVGIGALKVSGQFASTAASASCSA
jgi:hypothetical protein